MFTGSDAKLCKGKFVSGPLPSERNDETRMFTSCEETDKTTLTQTFYYIAVTRPKGGRISFALARTTMMKTEQAVSKYWVNVRNPNAPAVKREAEEDFGR